MTTMSVRLEQFEETKLYNKKGLEKWTYLKFLN